MLPGGSAARVLRRAVRFMAGVLPLVMALVLVPGQAAWAATSGPNSPSTASNVTGVGTVAWGTPSNALTSNNSRTTAAMTGNKVSNWLQVTGFGFAIPTAATINGITVEVEGARTGSGAVQDSSSRIVKGGTIQSTDVLLSGNWSTTEAYTTRGSGSQLWGTTWTPADVNASNFGYALSAKTTTSTSGTASVDHIRITITYTLPVYTQSGYRWFTNSNATSVGSALAVLNTAATLPSQNTPFRLRMLIAPTTSGLPISGNNFKLQFAKKGSGTCAAPSNAYADVTGATAIRYYDNSTPADGAALTTNANDPTNGGHTIRAQSYEESNNFTNAQSAVAASTEDGLWDFSLSDAGATGGTAYCFRAVESSGTAFTTYSQYPQITTAGTSTTFDIVDSGGASVSSPSVAFGAQNVSLNCATSTGTFGTTAQHPRVGNNSVAENWSLSMAATGGPTSNWNGTTSTYDFNDSSGCTDGADADSIGGRLTVDPSVGTLTPQGGCATTGISKGSSGSFTEGTTDSITLYSGTNASNTNCYWELTGVSLSQSIPASQPAASYLINMTLTLTVT